MTTETVFWLKPMFVYQVIMPENQNCQSGLMLPVVRVQEDGEKSTEQDSSNKRWTYNPDTIYNLSPSKTHFYCLLVALY